jgi:hypothetical protein
MAVMKSLALPLKRETLDDMMGRQHTESSFEASLPSLGKGVLNDK